MIRRSLFIGLTIALVAVIAVLVIQGRRSENKETKAPRPAELVRESKPTATRSLAPADLEIVKSEMILRPAAAPGGAEHRVVIRNRGQAAYGSALLRFAYLAPGDKPLGRMTCRVTETLQPGQERSIGGILFEKTPPGAVGARVEIVWAEIERQP
jgi:hypothetical protein